MKHMILFSFVASTCAFAVSPPLEKPGDKEAIINISDNSNSQIFSFDGDTYAHRVLITGHLIITKQEAADVVKALEILIPGVPEVYEKSEGTSGYGATMTCPPYQASMNATREQIDKGLKDLAWARAVLETWRAKVKEAGK